MAYLLLHSGLASLQLKARLGNPSWYRLAYSIFAVLGLLPLLWMAIQIESRFFFEPDLGSKIPSMALGFTAYRLIQAAMKLYGFSRFIGLKSEGTSELITTGILARMRHPIYTATLLFGAGFWLWNPTDLSLAMFVAWCLYLPLGIWLEERRLILEFGKEYIAYKKNIPAIFPSFS